MRKQMRLFLAFTLIVSYLVKPMGMVNAEFRAILGTDELAIEGTDILEVDSDFVFRLGSAQRPPLYPPRHINEPNCPVNAVAWGRFDDQSFDNQAGEINPQISVVGATWCLLDDGILEVNSGFINWAAWYSPWHNYRSQIAEIIFTGPITAGMILVSLFSNLENVTTINGLEYFDTSGVMAVDRMFYGARNLTELDVSGWDTSSVISMQSMFSGASNLTELDLLSWDTRRVANMMHMFFETSSLRILTLGENFIFVGNFNSREIHQADSPNSIQLELGSIDHSHEGEILFINNPLLPEISQTDKFTGYWQNVGSGSINQPLGEHTLTSTELMNHIPVPDTYVWQRQDAEVEDVVLISTSEELAAIGGPESADRTFALANDIHLTEAWMPIDGFLGTLDGRGYAIYNLFVAEESERYAVGLFGVLGEWGIQSHIVIENLRVYPSSEGLNASYANVLSVGGLVGLLRNGNLDIVNSYVSGNISGISDNIVSVGGLVGSDSGANTQLNISRSFATGSAISYTTDNFAPISAGGLVGSSYGSINISNSFAKSDIYSTDSFGFAGGLIGLLFSISASISNSYATGSVTAFGVGGLIGNANEAVDIINSYRVTTQYKSGTLINTLGEELTPEQMQNPTYLLDWCFDYIWEYPDNFSRLFGWLPWLRLFRRP